MKLYRSLMVALAVVTVLALVAGCIPRPGADAAPQAAPTAAPQPTAEPEKKLRIAYIRPTNEPYYKYGFDGAKMMAPMLDVEILGYISDMKPERELASVEDAITQKVDGIVLMSATADLVVAERQHGLRREGPHLHALRLQRRPEGQDGRHRPGRLQPVGQDHRQVGRREHPRGRGGRDHGSARPRRRRVYRDAFKAEMEKNPKLEVGGVGSRRLEPAEGLRPDAEPHHELPQPEGRLRPERGHGPGRHPGAQGSRQGEGGGHRRPRTAPPTAWSPSRPAASRRRSAGRPPRKPSSPCGCSSSTSAARSSPKLTITPMTVITKDNVSDATPWEPTAASTEATLEARSGQARASVRRVAGHWPSPRARLSRRAPSRPRQAGACLARCLAHCGRLAKGAGPMKVGIDSYCYHRYFGEVYGNQSSPRGPQDELRGLPEAGGRAEGGRRVAGDLLLRELRRILPEAPQGD